MGNDKISELKKEWSNDLYKVIEPTIELVRETNEDMRRYADSQINSLENIVAELESTLRQYEF